MKHIFFELKNNKEQKKWIYAGMFLACMILCVLGVTVLFVWKEYSKSIIDVQKKQMLNTVTSISGSLEHEIDLYKEDVIRLANITDYTQDMEYMDYELGQYCSSKKDFIKEAILKDDTGRIVSGMGNLTFSQLYGMASLDNGVTFCERKSDDEELYFVFSKETERGYELEIAVSVEAYYEELISNIQIGTNGYVVVKTSNGIILMHPEREQWGIEIIEGRESLYNIKELDSLQHMLKKQMDGDTDVTEYESYWWTDDGLPKVKKISAYTPVDIGDDFLIVSAVIDYNDIYQPIFNGYLRIGILFLGLFIVMIAFLGVFTYLAFQKKKNQEEIQYLRDLNEVLEQTRQSEEAITHQQRLQIMGTMTGGIAHEFNNMLTPIMGYADMLLDMLPSDSEAYDYVNEIFDASDRAKDVIVQISSLSRKNMETVFSFIPIKRLLNRTMKMIHSVCPVNVQISLNESYENEGFLGNETQMKQVILNLCVNAFHAIGKEKDGHLDISGCVKSRKEIEYRHDIMLENEWESYLSICITDNGCGMDSDTVEQIFTPFFTTKKTGKGTGLGLSVAEQIVHSHKGYICVSSSLGNGSSFYIYLPLQQEAQIHTLEQEQLDQKNSKKSVLIVDDNEKILNLLSKEFSRMKIKVDTAETPDEAKRALEHTTYEFILIDRTLAELHSGINFAMSIQEQYSDMIRILMVDQVKKDVIEAMQRHFIDAYVEKPVSAATIIEKIREIKSDENI